MSQHVSSSIIALLTDFGLRDNFVGVMKGVMSGIAPAMTRFIDITHAVPPQDVLTGTFILETSYRYFPAGTIFLCVVDPGVGSERHPIALHAGDWYFVGPDNGLFTPLIEEQTIHQVVALNNPDYQLSGISTTFHGRDIFAPAAAHIAAGVPLNALGTAVAAVDLLRLPRQRPQVSKEQIEAQLGYQDYYGNVITTIAAALLPFDLFEQINVCLEIPARNITITARRRFFAEGSEQGGVNAEPFLFIDSTGYLGIAIQNADAARQLGITGRERVVLRWG
jgi:S-adenosylmethionine hydrolase